MNLALAAVVSSLHRGVREEKMNSEGLKFNFEDDLFRVPLPGKPLLYA